MRLNLLSEEKSVSAGSLFHVLITRSQKKVVRIFLLFDFLNNLYLWPLVCDTVENSKRSFAFTTTYLDTAHGPLHGVPKERHAKLATIILSTLTDFQVFFLTESFPAKFAVNLIVEASCGNVISRKDECSVKQLQVGCKLVGPKEPCNLDGGQDSGVTSHRKPRQCQGGRSPKRGPK